MEIKKILNEDLKLNVPNPNFIRIRCLGKKLDPERIIRGENTPIKKSNIDNPANLFIEILENEEILLENQIQLYLFLRNVEKNTYVNKKSVIFTFGNMASSDQLYELCKKEYELRNISIAKNAKFFYVN